MSELNSAVEQALAAGKALGRHELDGTVYTYGDDGVPFFVTSQGRISAEPFLPRPAAQRATVKLDDAASFLAYVTRFKDADSVVFANLTGRAFEAVLDYHQADHAARWGKHRATFTCATTTDWNTWTTANKKPATQVDFARFLEDNLPNIVEPAGAALLEMCLTLEAKKDVQFRSAARLQNGEHQFRYEEVIDGRAGGSQGGTLAVPNGFVLGIEPFQGVGLKQVDARLRYRIKEGELTMWFELVRPDDVLKAAFDQIVAQIRTGLGETPVLAGAAPVIA